ncbi:hypothetical protein ACU4GD_08440 [Cupriavidus basilensis]
MLLPAPGRSAVIALRAVPDDACPAHDAGRHAGRHIPQPEILVARLAREMFEHPWLAWNAALVAERRQATPRLVRARLFAEGESLRNPAARAAGSGIRSTCSRWTRTHPAEWLARQVGLAGVAALRAACANTLGPSAPSLLADRNSQAAPSLDCVRHSRWRPEGPRPASHLLRPSRRL